MFVCVMVSKSHLVNANDSLFYCSYSKDRAVVRAACLESGRSRARTALWPSSFKETNVFPPLTCKDSILRDREVACSASDNRGSNFECCVWRAVSSHLPHNPQKVLLVQFSLSVHNGGLKPYSFHLISF